MKPFSGADVVKALGISQKVLTQWINRQLITPTRKARGPWDKNEFTLPGIIRIGIMKKLADAGFERPEAARIAFLPMDAPSGKAFSEVIDEVIKLCADTSGTTVLGTPPQHHAFIAFFRDEEGNYRGSTYSTVKGLWRGSAGAQLWKDLCSEPFETATIIDIAKLTWRVIEALGV